MSTATSLERQMLELINEERTSRGLDPLQLELRLNASAEEHSEWMLQSDVFSHTGSNGSSAGDRMRDAGFDFSGSWTWAENIAWQSERGAEGLGDDVINLHNSLMNSPGHRANILNPDINLIGIGIERGNFDGWDAVMVTQNFARTAAAVQIDTGTGTGGGGGATPGADQLELSTAGTLVGMGGNDTLGGSADDDKLSGGSGSDICDGGAGNDTLVGGNGADRLWGGADADRLYGGNGHDRMNGGNGNDVLLGRSGNDVFVFSPGRDVVRDFEAGNAAEDIDLGNASGITGFRDLVENHMIQRNGKVIIQDDQGNKMVLRDVALAELDADDFIF